MVKYLNVIYLTVFLFIMYIFPSLFMSFDQSWYESLTKPALTPPQWVFPVVWPILYFLLALSAALTLNTITEDTTVKRRYVVILLLHYIFLQLYSYFQFTLQNIPLATIDILFVVLTTLILFTIGRTINKRASLLLIPLIIWVVFASFLQVGILRLN